MIDGQITVAATADDHPAQLRIQPGTQWRSQHEGIILQFQQSSSGAVGFDYFAEDIREQWRNGTAVRP
jgi:hypothetical protein